MPSEEPLRPLIDVTIVRAWPMVRAIRQRVSEALSRQASELRVAAVMTASELVENAIKYGDAADGSDGIRVSLGIRPGLLLLEVSNRCANAAAVDELRARIDDITRSTDKEALYVAFPFAFTRPDVDLEVPLGRMRVERDQQPGACRDWYCHTHWVHLTEGARGVLWSGRDTPLVTLNDLFRGAWRRRLEPDGTLFAWAMHNYWHTNYPARQGGEEPVEVPIEDELDLHAFAPRDVPSVVDEYLAAAHAHGFTEERLVHCKGIGVQRRVVQGVLARHPLVVRFVDAPEGRGGWGATLVRLRG